jgi:aquaporin Z
MVTAGRMTFGEFIGYAVAQVIGAVIGAAILYIIASGAPGWGGGMGSNGWGEGYGGGYSMTAALVFEFVMTFIFVTVILGATGSGAAVGFAGLAIGLTLAAIHLVGIHVTGVSVNPARSIGPALFEGGRALSQLWLFIVAPLAGGAVAGLVYAAGLTRAHD